MAGAPKYKVYNAAGGYRAAFKDPAEAACLVAFLGHGATIRLGHAKRDVLWTEGSEDGQAHESYDHVARTVFNRHHNPKER